MVLTMKNWLAILASGLVLSCGVSASPEDGYFRVSGCYDDSIEVVNATRIRPGGYVVDDVPRWLEWCEARRTDGSIMTVHSRRTRVLRISPGQEPRFMESSFSIAGAQNHCDELGRPVVDEDGVLSGELRVFVGGRANPTYNGEWVSELAGQGILRKTTAP